MKVLNPIEALQIPYQDKVFAKLRYQDILIGRLVINSLNFAMILCVWLVTGLMVVHISLWLISLYSQ